jgi:hypothetical protein
MQLRRRFEKTHHAVTEGVAFNHDDLISLPSTLPLRRMPPEGAEVIGRVKRTVLGSVKVC